MNGQDFVRIINEAFAPFLSAAGFSMPSTAISGRLYRASFIGAENMVSVSFEPGDDSLFVVVFSRERGEWSNMDDRETSPRLSDLNTSYMGMVGTEERADNESYFKLVRTNDDVERSLLKAAKELRLVLPRYLAAQACRRETSD
jgi:hypothetical protein